jgi:hypothetical protein
MNLVRNRARYVESPVMTRTIIVTDACSHAPVMAIDC